ncbi:MAG: hypothetical protein L0H12_06095, partial [Nitrosospira sp.]|nr:hypothetical protein [Nitrosospira sp.]
HHSGFGPAAYVRHRSPQVLARAKCCPPELHATLDERGKRFDEQTDGHGLGLAIVRDIVDHYQGEIDFDTSALGGLRIEVKLMSQNSR